MILRIHIKNHSCRYNYFVISQLFLNTLKVAIQNILNVFFLIKTAFYLNL